MSVRNGLLMLLIALTTFIVVGSAAFLLLSTFGTAMLPGGAGSARAAIHYALVCGLLAVPVVLIALNKRLRGAASKDRP
jgi:hypothetical protein